MQSQLARRMEAIPLTIATTVRIGVTGHRVVENEPRVRARVRDVLQQLDRRLKNTPHALVVVSPLAEGADRLVAEEVLAWRSADGAQPCLEAILPLAADDYAADFATAESRNAFRALLDRAAIVQTSARSDSRTQAYAAVGRSVVQHCDVLIAIWSGESASGPGGTGEVVKYARQLSRTLFWINPKSGELVPEPHADRVLDAWAQLDAFNAERVNSQSVAVATRTWEDQFASHAAAAGLESKPLLANVRASLLPHFARVDLLAQRYQSRYANTGTAVYGLAAGAVATVVLQNLFFPQVSAVLWLEVVLMAGILGLLLTSRRGDWHRKYIDYRFLAERLRTALYLSVAGALRLTRSAENGSTREDSDWVTRAVGSILAAIHQPDLPGAPMVLLKPLLLQAWILDQADWFERKGERHHRSHERLARAGELVFATTLIAAAMHATGWAETIGDHSPFPRILTFLALGLPAVGAALAGLRMHREYLRTAERYLEMTRALRAIAQKVEQALNPEQLIRLLQEADAILREENQDWRVVIRFRELEPP